MTCHRNRLIGGSLLLVASVSETHAVVFRNMVNMDRILRVRMHCACFTIATPTFEVEIT